MTKGKQARLPVLRLPLMDYIGDFDRLSLDPVVLEEHPHPATAVHPPHPQRQLPFVSALTDELVTEVLGYVDQFDLTRLARTCRAVQPVAERRLYRQVQVAFNSAVAPRFASRADYLRRCGYRYTGLTMIFTRHSLLGFLLTLHYHPRLIAYVVLFVFDGCLSLDERDPELHTIQCHIVDFFGRYMTLLAVFNIAFADFSEGMGAYRRFVERPNVRNTLTKWYATSVDELVLPYVPPRIAGLFLLLEHPAERIAVPHVFEQLSLLSVYSLDKQGLAVLRAIELAPHTKMRLRRLAILHCHGDHGDALDFAVVAAKVDLLVLEEVSLKVDCDLLRDSECDCFGGFCRAFAGEVRALGGLPLVHDVAVENFADSEWLRPNQLLEGALLPLSELLTSFAAARRVVIDFATPGFKMFESTTSTLALFMNQLNYKLIDAFFSTAYPPEAAATASLEHLVLADFLTLFIYYKRDFSESFLHSCRCWGCARVVEICQLRFFPVPSLGGDIDSDTCVYVVIAYLMMKLQFDREVCLPIRPRATDYACYPIYKGAANSLHHGFHGDHECGCPPDPLPEHDLDNLLTTYLAHQLAPVVAYLVPRFPRLRTVMLHGIWFDAATRTPIYDDAEYPPAFMAPYRDKIAAGAVPPGRYGCFH